MSKGRPSEPPTGRKAAQAPAQAASTKQVVIYTDGACSGNPGPGGYGAVLLWNGHRKELSGGFRLTTNNRMELLGAIVALETLKEPCRVKLYSDSEYLVRAVTLGWTERWRARGWRLANGKPALNVDLWERLLALLQRHRVELEWVKGHAGVEENQRADRLATGALTVPGLPIDEGYQRPQL